jgi:hypothetical protein
MQYQDLTFAKPTQSSCYTLFVADQNCVTNLPVSENSYPSRSYGQELTISELEQSVRLLGIETFDALP